MKTWFYLASFVFLFIIVNPITNLAQEVSKPLKLCVSAGVAIPTGIFRSTEGATAGFATKGFCATLESSQALKKNVNWVTSFTLAINGVDDSGLKKQNDMDATAGYCMNTWALTGFGFESPLENGNKIYAVAQCGILVSSYPDITFSGDDQDFTQTTTIGTAFAFGTSIGMIVKNLNFGIRFVTGEPKFEQKVIYRGIVFLSEEKRSTNLLMFQIGVNF